LLCRMVPFMDGPFSILTVSDSREQAAFMCLKEARPGKGFSNR
jgi:hypothetical protein